MAIADSAQVATLKAAKVAGRIIASAQRLVERAHQAESGPTGFLKTPCSSSRLLDLNAVFSEQAKTIPHMTQTGPRH